MSSSSEDATTGMSAAVRSSASLMGVCETAPSVLYSIVSCLDFRSVLSLTLTCKSIRSICFGHSSCLTDFEYTLPNSQMHEHYVALETRAKHGNVFRRYRESRRVTLTLPFVATASVSTLDSVLSQSDSTAAPTGSTRQNSNTRGEYALMTDGRRLSAPVGSAVTRQTTGMALESNVQCSSILSHLSEIFGNVRELRLICDCSVVDSPLIDFLIRRLLLDSTGTMSSRLSQTIEHLVILVRLSDPMLNSTELPASVVTLGISTAFRKCDYFGSFIQRVLPLKRLSLNFPLSPVFYDLMAGENVSLSESGLSVSSTIHRSKWAGRRRCSAIGTVARLPISMPTVNGPELDLMVYSSAFLPLTSDKTSITRNTAIIETKAMILPAPLTSRPTTSASYDDYSSDSDRWERGHSPTPDFPLTVRMESAVRLQISLFEEFLPRMNSLHLHGSKSLMHTKETLESSGECSGTSALSVASHVLFALKEICISVSRENVDFIQANVKHVPQLKRLQLIVSDKGKPWILRELLTHFEGNYGRRVSTAEQSFPSSSVSGASAIWTKAQLAVAGISGASGIAVKNSAKQLRYLNVISKGTSAEQNVQIIETVGEYLRELSAEMTLLRTKIVIKFRESNRLDYLIAIVDKMAAVDYVFKRDTMTFVIIMPWKQDSGQSGTMHIISKRPTRSKVPGSTAKVSDKYTRMLDDDADGGSGPMIAGSGASSKTTSHSGGSGHHSSSSKRRTVAEELTDMSLLGLKLLMESKHIGTLKVKRGKVYLVKTRRYTEECLIKGGTLAEDDYQPAVTGPGSSLSSMKDELEKKRQKEEMQRMSDESLISSIDPRDTLVKKSDTASHMSDEFSMTSRPALSIQPVCDDTKWLHSCYYCKVLKS